MKVTSTLSVSGVSTEKRLELPNSVYHRLRQTAEQQNKEFSQGKIVYEVLNFSRNSPVSDSLSGAEEVVDDQLATVGSQALLTAVESLSRRVDGDRVLAGSVPANQDADGVKSAVGIRLPDEAWEQVYEERKRSIGFWLEDFFVEFVESPYTSRADRMEFKRDLINYINGDDASHRVLEAVVQTEESDMELEGVERVRGEVENILGETEWYLDRLGDVRDDITLDELKSRGESIPQTPREKRVEALQIAIENEPEYTPDEDEVEDDVERVYDVETVTGEYVDEMELSWFDVRVRGFRDRIETMASAEAKDVDKIPNSTSAAELYRVKDEWIDAVAGGHQSREDLRETVDQFFKNQTGDKVVSRDKHAEYRGKLEKVVRADLRPILKGDEDDVDVIP